MDTIESTNIQDMIRAGRIVEAGALLTMHNAALSREERSLLEHELHRLQAEAAALVAQAEALEFAGKTAEAKAVYESILSFASDYPGVQSQIKRLQDSLFLTKAVKRRSQRIRQANPIVQQPARKKPSLPLLGAGLATCVAVMLLLLLFLKTPPQQKSAPEQAAPAAPVQMAAVQPVNAPAITKPQPEAPPQPHQVSASEPAPAPAGPEQAKTGTTAPSEAMNPPEISATLPQPDPAPPQPAALPLPAAPGKEASYTVQSGDSLSLIAVRLFCHEDTWTHIYRLNKEQIAVPHKLQPGMVLRLTGIESRCRSTP